MIIIFNRFGKAPVAINIHNVLRINLFLVQPVPGTLSVLYPFTTLAENTIKREKEVRSVALALAVVGVLIFFCGHRFLGRCCSPSRSRRGGDASRRDDGPRARLVRLRGRGFFRRRVLLGGSGRSLRRVGLSHFLRRRVGVADGQEPEGQDRGGRKSLLDKRFRVDRLGLHLEGRSLRGLLRRGGGNFRGRKRRGLGQGKTF